MSSADVHCCLNVAERWWLVAGLRSVGVCGVADAGKVGSDDRARCDVDRFTSLLGGSEPTRAVE